MRNTAVNLIGNQPSITGPTRLLATAHRDLGKAGGQVASGLIPGAIREWARRQDQFRNGVDRRKAHGFVEEIQSKVPFLREELEDAEAQPPSKRKGGRPR